MPKKLNKTFLKIFICSIIIYLFYALVTPITISITAYLAIFVYSIFLVLLIDIILSILKGYLDKSKS